MRRPIPVLGERVGRIFVSAALDQTPLLDRADDLAPGFSLRRRILRDILRGVGWRVGSREIGGRRTFASLLVGLQQLPVAGKRLQARRRRRVVGVQSGICPHRRLHEPEQDSNGQRGERQQAQRCRTEGQRCHGVFAVPCRAKAQTCVPASSSRPQRLYRCSHETSSLYGERLSQSDTGRET